MYQSGKKKGNMRRITLIKHATDKKGRMNKADRTTMSEKYLVIRDEEAEMSIEAKMFELLDLFMRDSSLGVY